MQQVVQNQITLISHKLCPYVQRTVIALTELEIKYKRIDIDLNNKPDWFNALSPLGKVPVMVVDDDVVLFESAAIAEYINDIGNGDLLSTVAVDRARQRAWIAFASTTLSNIGQLYSATDETQFETATQQLNRSWGLLEKNLPERNSDNENFFTGIEFSLVDAAFAPVFRYFDLFEKFAEFKFLKRYPNVDNWRQNLTKRTSVINAVSQDYAEQLTRFVAKRESYMGQLAKQHQLKHA